MGEKYIRDKYNKDKNKSSESRGSQNSRSNSSSSGYKGKSSSSYNGNSSNGSGKYKKYGDNTRNSSPQGKFNSDKSQEDKPYYSVICASCNVETNVPFKPTVGGRPVYCKTCFKKNEEFKSNNPSDNDFDSPRDIRTSYRVICDDCNAETTVPFMPSEGGKPIYCRNCFQKRKPKRDY